MCEGENWSYGAGKIGNSVESTAWQLGLTSTFSELCVCVRVGVGGVGGVLIETRGCFYVFPL